MKKRLLAGITVLLLLIGALMAFVGCNKVESISVDRNNLPQTKFVLGTEPDLSKMLLTVDGTTIPLDSEGVTVSGYDKDRPGDQTLTVTYGGKTTEFTVTVVPRFQAAQKYVYFLDETFADAQPRLNVTRNDGTTFTVTADDLTVTGFDSSEPAETLTVTAACEEGGVHYEGTFDVSVVSPTVTFRKPIATAYGSHESELDLMGASLRLQSPDGSTTRYVSLTDLETEGFRPQDVTAQNPEETQTITVYYRGRQMGSFDVTVTYSDVSQFKDAAKQLDALDWNCYRYPTAEDPGMAYPADADETLTALARNMLTMYLGFSDEKASYISQEELNAVARLAVVCAYNEWMQTVEAAFADVFTVSETGELAFACQTYAAAQAGAAKLKDDADADMQTLQTLTALLTHQTIAEKCADSLIYDPMTEGGETVEIDLTIADLASLIPETSFFGRVADILDWTTEAYDLLDENAVPADWTMDDLKALSAETVDEVYRLLSQIGEREEGAATVFPLLNAWRAKQDYFEIIYRYYYNDVLENASTEALGKLDGLINVMLPLPLEALRLYYSEGPVAQEIMQMYGETYDPTSGDLPLLMESTYFLYMYEEAEKGGEALLAMGDDMYTFLYLRYFQGLLSDMTTGPYGYLALRGASAYDEAVQEVWNDYFALWLAFSEDEDFILSSDFDTGVKEMFEAFVALMPTQQYYFIASVSYLYPTLPTTALYPDTGYLYSDFATFIYAYYLDALGVNIDSEEENTAYDVFTSLMLALEGLARGDTDYFCTMMKDAVDAYAAESWTGAAKETFNSYLGTFYNKYLAYYQMFEATTEGDQTIWEYKAPVMDTETEAAFAALADAIDGTSLAKTYIEDLAELMGSVDLYLPFLASYEQVRTLSAQLTGGSNEIADAYYFMPYGEGAYREPLYNGVYEADDAYERYLATLGIDQSAYEQATGLRAFLATYANYFWTAAMSMYGISYPGESFEFTAETVSAMLKAFYEFDADTQYLLIVIDSLNLFHGGLEQAAYGGLFTKAPVLEMVSNLLSLQITYVAYRSDPDGSYEDPDTGETIAYRQEVLGYWEAVSASYEIYESDEVPEEEFTKFCDYFGDMYAHYEAVCTALAQA